MMAKGAKVGQPSAIDECALTAHDWKSAND